MSEEKLPQDELVPEAAEEAVEEVREVVEEADAAVDAVTEEVAEDAGAVVDAVAEEVAEPTESFEAVAAEVAEPEVAEPTESFEAVAAEIAEQVEPATIADETPDERVEAAVRNVAEEAQEEAPVEEKPARKKRERRSKQARAAKGEAEPVAAPVANKAPRRSVTLGTPAWIAISVASLALGLVLGHFVLGGGPAGNASFTGKSTVAESELDSAYATYTYNGATETVTVREAIEQTGTIESVKQEDGTYTLPSAEAAISVARNAIIAKEADSRNITISDEDLAAYAEQAIGTSDYDAIASTYGMDAESVKELLTSSARMNALRDEVVGVDAPTMPDAPTAAEEGKESEVTKEYAEYIINLAGDEWNADKGEWASKDGAYATALDGQDFSKDGASYAAAQAAYYVAYQQYSQAQTEISNKWTEFVNGLLSNASIEVSSLVS